jgi:predicted methyltransferase
MSEERERMNVASTGLLGTASSFLDEHFETCRPSYEAMLRSVGVRPGRRVLDAACGAGSFLPLMSKLVGPPRQHSGVRPGPGQRGHCSGEESRRRVRVSRGGRGGVVDRATVCG